MVLGTGLPKRARGVQAWTGGGEAPGRGAPQGVRPPVRAPDLICVHPKPGPAPGPGIVSIVFRGTVATGRPEAGREALEVRWFKPDEIPWEDLAYETTGWALSAWIEHKRHAGPALR